MITTDQAIAQITTAYHTRDAQADHKGAGVHLGDIVDLIDLPDALYRQTILAMVGAGTMLLEPEPKLRNLAKADHDAAIMCGGEIKHTIWIR